MARKVLVVGAAGGVGTEVVRQLLAQGSQVIATVLNASEAAQVRAANAGTQEIIELDCSDAEGVKRSLDARLAAHPDLSAAVVTAAISPYGPVETGSLAVARRTLEINVLSGIAVYQAAMPLLRANKGRIVYMSSMAGKMGMPFIGYYTASKFALEGAVNVMRTEAAKWGVELVLIEPGGIRTPMMSDQIKSVPEDLQKLDAKTRDLYGYLYEGFAKLAGGSYQTALDPAVVAATVVGALNAAKPKVRYQVGKDSKMLCFLAWLLPQRTFENMILKQFA